MRARGWEVVGPVVLLGAAATAALALVDAFRPTLPEVGLLVALFAATLILEGRGVALRWRGHRTTLCATEAVVFVALALLPLLTAPLLIVAGRVAISLVARRPPIKVAFNVGQVALAASLGGLAASLLPDAPLLAAALGAGVYGLATEATVAVLFARLESISPWRVYRERLAVGQLASTTLGIGLGLCAVALWGIHPLALAGLAPLLAGLVHLARLQGYADRQIELHRRLATDQQALVGCRDDGAIAERILATTADVLDAGRARFTLAGFARAVEPDPPRGGAPLLVEVVGRDGAPLGRLEAWSRPAKPAFGEVELELLRAIAGQAAHALESARALREVAASRDALARQERMSTLGTLVAGVAHEVNNPLTYLGGNLDLALDDLRALHADVQARGAELPIDLPETIRNIETASRGATHIAHVVSSLRVVARQRQGGAREPIPLNDVAANVATLVRAGVPPTIVLVVEPSPARPSVLASATDLHQALLNLAKNGVEALGERAGTLALRVRVEDGRARLVVEDDGPGIPPEVLARIRDPFFTTKKEGTGLGIPIVESIAREHGGELSIESTPGAGARFTLDFPLVRPQSFSSLPGLAAPEGSL